MKKTYNINLNGQVFCIDDDAYIQLQSYIETLEQYYLKEEGGKEIMADIESRIGELFRESLQKNHKAVISLPDIEHVISIMGTPDVIINDAQEYADPAPIKRKLYRDAENQVFGGVAAGIAAYLDIAIVWVRLAFILLAFFYGITIAVYFILWISIPKALTAKQKLEMKGKSINVSNLEKNIRDTYQQVKKNSKLRDLMNGIGQTASRCLNTIGKTLESILSVLLSILAVIGVSVGGLLFLFFLGAVLFYPAFLPEHCLHFLGCTFSACSLWTIKIITLLLIEIPLFVLVYYSLARLFHFQVRRPALVILACVWLLACLGGIFTGIYQGTRFSQKYHTRNEIQLVPDDTTSGIFYVKFNLRPDSRQTGAYTYGSDCYLYYPDSNVLCLKPRLHISRTTAPWPSLEIRKEARGASVTEAIRNTEIIRFGYRWEQDTLHIDDYFVLDSLPWRANRISLELSIPEGYKVKFIETPRKEIVNPYIFQDSQCDIYSDTFINEVFTMKNGRLAGER